MYHKRAILREVKRAKTSPKVGIITKLTSIIQNADPALRNRLIIISALLILLNVGVWIAILFASHMTSTLIGLASIAYGLGLRHAVDADHIAAIDNTTRKLMQDGKKPVATGLFFSLGHSTIVVVLSAIVALSAGFVSKNLPAFQETGSLIGTTVSSIFLLAIGIINLIVLIETYKVWRKVVNGGTYERENLHQHLHAGGFFIKFFHPVLRGITSSWQMYPVGFLFGLGFDTASEVGLLSISAASGANNIPFWEIMLLPIAFTAGMSLIDTVDGILMLGAYGWAYIKPVRKLYYNMNITLISVLIALFIGGIEALQIISEKTGVNNTFFMFINSLDLGSLGYIIIGTFILSWVFSVAFYKFQKYDQLDEQI